MREERFFTAEETVTNERIDKFLSAQMPDHIFFKLHRRRY